MSLNQKENSAENFKKAIYIAKQKKDQSLFVFDLDSTLFCMKYRTQAIIRSCINNKEFYNEFSKHLETIKKVEVTERDWSVEEIMSRYGFLPTEPLVIAIQKLWRKSFFKNDYLNLDKPYRGCVSFVQHISKLGSKVFYLTARNRVTMYEGTVKSLKAWNFPLENEKQLIMKEKPETKDAIYKTEHLKKLAKNYETILFFENEPVILNEVSREIPQIHLFWINSTHSRQKKPPKTALPLHIDYTWQQK